MESYPSVLDPAHPDVRIDFRMAEAEFSRRSINRATAEQMVAIHAVLGEAREFPEVFVGAHALASNGDDVEFAERAAAADLAMRLSVAENTIRSLDQQVTTLKQRTPTIWSLFREGDVSPANARTVAEIAATLPHDDSDLWHKFDEAVRDDAARLAPARFRTRARVTKAKIHAEAADDRHRARMEDRRVVFEADIDGMGWLSAYLPGHVATMFMASIDEEARAIVTDEGETRTLAQIKADLFGDRLIGAGDGNGIGVRVGVMVPVMTLLGLSEEPAMLDGFGPIDPATARKLVSRAPSFYRILTHPITGTVLDLDRVTLRIPADMRRWLQTRDQVCTAPGCGKSAVNCDLDHVVDRQFGGTTRVTNLVHLCRKHHRMKHKTLWRVTQSATGQIEWTSPTGFKSNPDPPPF